MSFALIQTALATLFVVVWLFIGGTMLADRLAESRRRRRLIEESLYPAGSPPVGPHRHGLARRPRTERGVRPASLSRRA